MHSPMSYISRDVHELIRACVELGDPAAWQEFINRFHKLIASVALRTAARCGERSPAVIDDLVQEIYLKLCDDDCRVLREFQNEHPDAIYGYLKAITANAVNDHFRALSAEKRGRNFPPQDLDGVYDLSDPRKLGSPLTIERRILLDQIDSRLRNCSPSASRERDRLIFHLFYREGLSAKEIAAIPSIRLEIKGVESAILRITKLVKTELARSPDQGRRQRKIRRFEEGLSSESAS